MKKMLIIFVMCMLLYSPSSFAIVKGKGEVKLSERSLDNFVYYIKGDWPGRKKGRYNPAWFVLSSDGTWSTFQWCPYSECWSNEKKSIEQCETTTGVQCGVFAKRRTIYWENGINTKTNKAKLKSKMSYEQIKSELTRLGFYGKTTTVTKKDNLTNEDIVEQLKTIKKLYDEGALTKEEFQKAKKKLLN